MGSTCSPERQTPPSGGCKAACSSGGRGSWFGDPPSCVPPSLSPKQGRQLLPLSQPCLPRPPSPQTRAATANTGPTRRHHLSPSVEGACLPAQRSRFYARAESARANGGPARVQSRTAARVRAHDGEAPPNSNSLPTGQTLPRRSAGATEPFAQCSPTPPAPSCRLPRPRNARECPVRRAPRAAGAAGVVRGRGGEGSGEGRWVWRRRKGDRDRGGER